MPASPNHPSAVVVLPASLDPRSLTSAERRWLGKGSLRTSDAAREPLQRVLEVLGRPAIGEGLAALRKWGQTGERPDGWVCGADPVYLEARLDHLCLFALDDLEDEEFAGLIGEVQARLGDREYAFSCIGSCGYLASAQPMPTARVSALTAHGELPDRFLPAGREAATHDRLQSELQMLLHGLEMNRAREATGRPPVNALWFWGGGAAPEGGAGGGTLPVLFSDDPLTRGYWLAAGGECAAWPGSFAACIERAGDTFVAVSSRGRDDAAVLAPLRQALGRGALAAMTLLFGDGLRVDLRRRDRFRFWRRELPPSQDGAP